MKTRVLVTGANGYIGEGIVRTLLDKSVDIIATDFSVERIDSRAKRISADLFTIEDPYEFFEKPDIVLHLAWRDGFKHDSENHIYDLPNHYLFLRKLIESGLKHLSVLGSVHEIGFFEGSVDENTPTCPQSLYGISKNALRQMIELLAKNANICLQWIRGFYIVGNTHAGSSVFSKITQAEEDGMKEFPFVKGINQFDFIDYEEFCKQLAAVIMQESITGIINCCSGRPERLSERVERFIEDNHYSIKLIYGAFQERPYDSKAIWGDSEKIDAIMKEAGR